MILVAFTSHDLGTFLSQHGFISNLCLLEEEMTIRSKSSYWYHLKARQIQWYPPHTIDLSYWYSFESSRWDKSNGTHIITPSHNRPSYSYPFESWYMYIQWHPLHTTHIHPHTLTWICFLFPFSFPLPSSVTVCLYLCASMFKEMASLANSCFSLYCSSYTIDITIIVTAITFLLCTVAFSKVSNRICGLRGIWAVSSSGGVWICPLSGGMWICPLCWALGVCGYAPCVELWGYVDMPPVLSSWGMWICPCVKLWGCLDMPPRKRYSVKWSTPYRVYLYSSAIAFSYILDYIILTSLFRSLDSKSWLSCSTSDLFLSNACAKFWYRQLSSFLQLCT